MRQLLLPVGLSCEREPLQDLSAAFQAGDMQQAADLTTQLRYISRIREAIVHKM
jgi:hypothetical protein